MTAVSAPAPHVADEGIASLRLALNAALRGKPEVVDA